MNIFRDEPVSGGDVLAVRPNLDQRWRTEAGAMVNAAPDRIPFFRGRIRLP